VSNKNQKFTKQILCLAKGERRKRFSPHAGAVALFVPASVGAINEQTKSLLGRCFLCKIRFAQNNFDQDLLQFRTFSSLLFWSVEEKNQNN
jgi:hypothetical protein